MGRAGAADWLCADGPVGGLKGLGCSDGDPPDDVDRVAARGPVGIPLAGLLGAVCVVTGGGICRGGPGFHAPRPPPRGVPKPLRETYPLGPVGGTGELISDRPLGGTVVVKGRDCCIGDAAEPLTFLVALGPVGTARLSAAGPRGGVGAVGDVFSDGEGLGASRTGMLLDGVGGGGERTGVSSFTRTDGGRGLFLRDADLLVIAEEIADSLGGGEGRLHVEGAGLHLSSRRSGVRDLGR